MKRLAAQYELEKEFTDLRISPMTVIIIVFGAGSCQSLFQEMSICESVPDNSIERIVALME